MDRRMFIGGVAGGLFATPLGARAQPAGKVYRIGILEPIPAAQNEVVQAVSGIDLHNVPQNWFMADLDHRLRPNRTFLTNAGAEPTS